MAILLGYIAISDSSWIARNPSLYSREFMTIKLDSHIAIDSWQYSQQLDNLKIAYVTLLPLKFEQ